MTAWQTAPHQHLPEVQRLISLGLFAATIAHDARNLLTAVGVSVELISAEIDPASPAYESVETARSSLSQITALLGQVLAFASGDRNNRTAIDLNATLGDMGNWLSVIGIRTASIIYDRTPVPMIAANPIQIRQVVMNLLMNACEALPPDEGAIIVATKLELLQPAMIAKIPYGTKGNPGPYVRLTVADTGCGMDEATLQRSVEPFFTTKGEGRGLGMAATLMIVQEHDGLMDISSTPGNGTTVRIWFPVMSDR